MPLNWFCISSRRGALPLPEQFSKALTFYNCNTAESFNVDNPYLFSCSSCCYIYDMCQYRRLTYFTNVIIEYFQAFDHIHSIKFVAEGPCFQLKDGSGFNGTAQ